MTQESPMLKAALTYSLLGRSVIPVGKDKKPCIPWKNFQKERANEEQIRKWFQKFPDANIGIVTGKISEIIIVDVEKGGKIDDLPKTLHTKTGGGGYHFYYRYDPLRPIKNATRIRTLTDIRGDGGYVVAPPSIHASGKEYEWVLPETEIKELAEFPYWLLSEPVKNNGEEPTQQISGQLVFEGNRNTEAAKYSGKLIHDLDRALWDTAGWAALKDWNQNSCKPSLEEVELKGIWKSIKKSEGTKSQRITKGQPTKEIYSAILKDKTILETLYDSEKDETSLLVYHNGNIEHVSEYADSQKNYLPVPPTNSLIAENVVRLPSQATPYSSEHELLEEVRGFVHEYVDLPEDFEFIASLYILFTWVYDTFHELAYLRVIGDFGCGKSRFLKVMEALCYKAMFFSGATSSSAMFRMINGVRGTVILDEADFHISDTTAEIVKILNAGFQKGIPVFRSEVTGNSNNKSFSPEPFHVFGPKVIASRMDFSDEALESRCLSNTMSPTQRDIPLNTDDSFDKKALLIRNMLLMFRLKKLEEGIILDKLPPLSIESRLKQIITPMYSTFRDQAVKSQIISFIQKKQETLTEMRFSSFEGEILRSLLEAKETSAEPTMNEITDIYNTKFAGKFQIKARKIGAICEKVFLLHKKKTSGGIVVILNEENEAQIEMLKSKYGLIEPEMNVMNEMNNTGKNINLTIQEVHALFNEELP